MLWWYRKDYNTLKPKYFLSYDAVVYHHIFPQCIQFNCLGDLENMFVKEILDYYKTGTNLNFNIDEFSRKNFIR